MGLNRLKLAYKLGLLAGCIPLAMIVQILIVFFTPAAGRPVLLMVLAALVFSAGALLFSRWLGYQTIKNITHLSMMAGRAAQGELELELNISSADETGEMADSFNQLMAYLKEMSHIAESLAKGDLTIEVKPHSEKDQLGKSLEQMVNNLRLLVQQVGQKTEQVGAAAGQLANTSEMTHKANTQITSTIQQVAQGAQLQAVSVSQTYLSIKNMSEAMLQVKEGTLKQAEAVSQMANMTGLLTGSVQQVAEAAQLSSVGAQRTSQITRNGAQIIDEAVAEMEKIKTAIGILVSRINEMGRWSGQIGEIVETIQDIAAQTNLLALNAAIEAARAGDHGRGFSVVADEVRKLAVKSATSTKEVAQLVHEIRRTVLEANQAMDASSSEVQHGVEKTSGAGLAMKEILQSVDSLYEREKEILMSTQKMKEFVNRMQAAVENVNKVVEENQAASISMQSGALEVNQAMHQIASVSEENSAATEEVSAASEEMHAQVEEVSQAAQSLNNMAVELQQAVIKLSVSKKGGSTARGASFNGRIQFVKQRYGEAAFQKVLQRLPKDVCTILSQPLDNNAEILRDYLEALTDAIRQELSGGSDDILREMAAFRAQVDLTTHMAQYFHPGDPGFVMHRVDLILRHNWGGDVPVLMQDLGPAHMLIQVAKVGKIPREACTYNNPGWFEGAIALSGGKPKVKKTRCVYNGDPCCEYDVQWEMIKNNQGK